MKDEIKEIIDKLKDGNWYEELDLTGTMWIELRWEETHLLLDCITNLQKENERLAKEIDMWNGLYNIEFDKARKYKSRCEKAIELISKEFLCYDNESDEYIQGKKAINILQGEGKDE